MERRKGKKKEERKGGIFDIFDIRIFGMSIWDLVNNLAETRERLLEQRGELEKLVGDRVKIDYDIRVGGIRGERLVSSRTGFQGLWDDLARERAEWKAKMRRLPVKKFTKEEISRAIEELERERAEFQKELEKFKKEEEKK